MVEPGKELSSIDFASMIGGPLMAVVDAQAKAALSSVNFIKAVGFKAGTSEDPEAKDTGEPIYVTFKYPKEVAAYQPAVKAVAAVAAVGTPDTPGYVAPVAAVDAVAAIPAQIQEMKLEVPILTMLPIPFIRIEETTIDFHAKITSVEYQSVDTSMKLDVALEAKQRWPGGSAKLNVGFSYQKKTNQGSTVDRTYSLDIHVRAVQDEMPAGMEKILGILEDAIRSQPLSVPNPVVVA